MVRSFYLNNYLSRYNYKNVVYVAYVGQHKNHNTFKYGISSDVFQREYMAHRKNFPKFEMLNIFKTNYNTYVETVFEKELKIRDIHQQLSINNKRQTELFITTEQYSYEFIETMLKDIIYDFEIQDERKIKLEMEKMALKKLELQLQIKQCELEYAKYIYTK